uniref:Uncharacterized protein n=1 Tax=Lepeophtheirus salmonis TaxID=72036 RepID=A0A0K2TBK9_LEPSM
MVQQPVDDGFFLENVAHGTCRLDYSHQSWKFRRPAAFIKPSFFLSRTFTDLNPYYTIA